MDNKLEILTDYADCEHIDIVDYDFDSSRIKGLYCDNTIAISKKLETSTEKACILAEEIGHHKTSSGNILDQSVTQNRKQEYRARLWAYDYMIGLSGIIKAYKSRRISSAYDMADFLNVTEEFLIDALYCYKQKYGVCVGVSNYFIIFEPTLAVIERIG